MSLFLMTPYGRKMIRRHLVNRIFDEGWTDEDDQVAFPVNLVEESDAYILKALLPGVATENLNIQIVNDTVTIQGDIQNEEHPNSGYIKNEIPTGRFSRVVHIPEHVDANQASADLTDGVLRLRLPKTEDARPKMIKVKKITS